MNWNRISVKLSLTLTALFLIVMVSLGYAVDRIFSNFFYHKTHQEVDELSSHFVKMVHTGDGIRTEMISTMAEFSKVELFVVDKQGKLIGKSGSALNVHYQMIEANDISLMLQGNELLREYESHSGQVYLVSAKPIPDQEVIRGGVIVISSMDMAQASVLKVRQLLLWVGISGFIIAAGCSFMLSRKMSRPLLNMERATRQIAAGQLETRVTTNSQDEIGSLANAINDLARDLQRYRDTRSEFFANISHELKTPITYVEGYAKIVSQELYDTEEEKRQYMDIISQEAKRLNCLIHDLFDLSKMEEGRIPLQTESIHISELIIAVIAKVEKKARTRGLQIEYESLTQATVQGDPLRMEQIFLNLLDNAIRYTHEGQITVRIKLQQDKVIIIISDTGCGIPEEDLPYLFERFYRVEKSRSRDYGGSGLGLAITKKLVELHHGSIHVSSQVGIGSTFEVHLQQE